MAKREVTVVINGEEFVSKAAESASEGLENFGKKSLSVSAIAAKAAAAYFAIAEGLRMVAGLIGGSLKAYDDLNASQRKLEGTAKLLGVSQKYLLDLVDEGRDQFSLSSGVAKEYAMEVAKLALKSGDASSATQLLAAFLDLGASRGLTATESLQKVAQSILGIDEGTDALFGKNPSGLWADFAEKIGRSASKFSDQDKAAALAYATLEAGIKVGGSYSAYLQSAAGQQDVLNQRMIEAEASFGKALQPVRMLGLELGAQLMPALGPLARILGGALAAAVVTVSKVFNILYGTTGLVIEGIGKLTNNSAMETWGKNAVAAANALGKQLNEAGEAAGRAIRGVDDEAKNSAAQYKIVEDKRAEVIRAQQKILEDAKNREGQAHKSASDAAKNASEISEAAATRFFDTASAKLGNPLAITIGITEGAIKKLGETSKLQLPPEVAETFAAHMQTLSERAEASRLKMIGLKDEAGKGRDTTKDVAENMGNVADAALKAADEFGVIDEKAGKSLESAKRIFDTFKDMATKGFTFAGAIGIVSGVASLVNTMMGGDADRRRLMRENNQRLAEVRDGLAEFNLEISGTDQQTLTDILTEGLGDGPFTGSSGMASLLDWLKNSGFSEGRLDQIAKDLKINIRDKNGNIFYDGLVSLLTALMGTNQGPRKNFGNDLSALEDSFSVNQTDTAGQVQQLGNLGGQYSKLFEGIVDMNDLGGTRTRLRQLFKDFQDGKISLRDMGGMSRSQFQSFLTMLIGRVDQAIGPTGSAPDTTGGSGSTDVGGGGSNLVVGGGTSVTVDTVQSVIKAMDTNLANVLTSHTVIHERIAVATESSAASLMSIDSKMDTLIAVTAGPDRADAMIEEQRYLLKVQQGGGAAF